MKKLPTEIANFAITYRCNSRCQNCNIWQKKPENELNLDEISSFFSENRALLRNVKSLQLTGGEPFLRSDLPEIAHVVTKNIPGCMVWVPSNGLEPDLIKKQSQRMLSDGVKLGVSISLDGISTVNDNIRGIAGSYILARNTLSHLISVKKTQPILSVSVGFTLTPDNMKEAPIIQRIAYNYGADFSFRPVNKSDFYYSNVNSKSLNPEDLTNVLHSIAYNAVNQKGRYGALTLLRYIQGVHQYLNEGRILPCTAGSNSFFLDPVGNVYPCLVMENKIGNIREQSFESIWKSERANEARDMVSNKMCPTCWLECEAFREINKDKIELAKTFFRSLINLDGVAVT